MNATQQHRIRLAAAAACGALLAGCSTGGAVVAPSQVPSAQPSRFEPVPSQPAPTGGSVPASRMDAILADLRARSVATDAVTVVSARNVTWPNGALGCPEPGAAYTDALVPGMEVIVAASGTTYDYHFGRDDSPLLCTRAHGPISASPNA